MSWSDEQVMSVVKTFQACGLAKLVYETEASAFVLRRGSAGSAKPAPHASETLTLTAHKLGILRRKVAEGDAVAEGGIVAEIDVIGVCHPVTVARAGRLLRWIAEDGSFVEWGAPVATLELD